MIRFCSHSEEETCAFAADLAKGLHGGTVVAFTGGLGVGKTAFVRGALRGLGRDVRVSSPTFALVNDYGGSPAVYHFDMYRVASWDDLYAAGFFDFLRDDAILFVEWSENITAALPAHTIFIHMAIGETPTERVIAVTGEGIA